MQVVNVPDGNSRSGFRLFPKEKKIGQTLVWDKKKGVLLVKKLIAIVIKIIDIKNQFLHVLSVVCKSF